jgi:exonuclease III
MPRTDNDLPTAERYSANAAMKAAYENWVGLRLDYVELARQLNAAAAVAAANVRHRDSA